MVKHAVGVRSEAQHVDRLRAEEGDAGDGRLRAGADSVEVLAKSRADLGQDVRH
jgi:hypothetical protein